MSVKISGLKELRKKLNDMQDKKAIKEIVKENGSELELTMKKEATFKGKYTEGDTRRSISTEFAKDDLVTIVAPSTDYAPYLEYGTRFMDKQPFVKPAFNKQKKKFISDLKELVK